MEGALEGVMLVLGFSAASVLLAGGAWKAWPPGRRRIAESSPDEPAARNWARVAMRVHAQAFLKANGSLRYVADMARPEERAEVLARALFESQLSSLLSGAQSGMPGLVLEQIRTVWGDDASLSAARDVYRLHGDDATAYGRRAVAPQADWLRLQCTS